MKRVEHQENILSELPTPPPEVKSEKKKGEKQLFAEKTESRL
jgi:hypothetical protein